VPNGAPGEEASRLTELRTENQLLRRRVTDLLLEKMKLEQALAARQPGGSRRN
jgi:hypothetical protein